MSEKVENEKEEKEEREMVDHWNHEHPLKLVDAPAGPGGRFCYGCLTHIRRGEKGYRCSQECGYDVILHEECAEAPRKIRHALHPQHTLTQQFNLDDMEGGHCSICQKHVLGIFYRCTSAECTLVMHIRCAQGSDMMYAAEGDKRTIHHPSHPDHELKLWRRSCSFKCDACGTTGAKGSSYTCTDDACEYWIHERCASLPQNIQREDHNHSLSLSFHVPPQYLKYDYSCDVCRKRLLSKHWIYHCELCSYVVHLTCAFDKLLLTNREKGIMEFPINDGADLIGAFLRRQGVDTHSLILHHDVVDYEFHHHKLRLVSSSSSFQEEENGDDDDDEEDYSCRKSELICDGCITPILMKQSPSSSSGSKDYYYMRCSISSCEYYLHLACFQLPTQLSSLPLLHKHDHSFVLQSGDNRKPWRWSICGVCGTFTNGLFYGCTKCDYGFTVDIKCASMPETIYHAAHPPHPLNLLSPEDTEIRAFDTCDGCNGLIWGANNSYACGTSDFIVHFQCAVLPASSTSRRWDKHHPLPLTHDATLNHPGDFYCNQCEQEMNPKSWMYHCRSCDISFHPECLKTTSGGFRNIKFGQKYVIEGAHCHTLTYQILTTKRHCDLCCYDMHERLGFYCASCIFFICFEPCGQKMIEDGNIKAVENEIKEEREMVDHWIHEHPLTLVRSRGGEYCYGCLTYYRRGEKGYGCSQKCGYAELLHEDCAEAPRKIRHAMHPQHTLTQQFSLFGVEGGRCPICQWYVWGIYYRCTSAECTILMHSRCAQGSDMMYAAECDKRTIHHPSHPEHQLLFLRRSCSFKCDACGTTGAKGSSYLCTNDDCEYWIHERCASLPQNIQREEHNHSLSLSFHVPPQYLRHKYHCDVCRKRLVTKNWVYHCELCSYVVHLTCAFKKSLLTTREKGIMEFPISDVAVGEDLIGDFVRRQGVDTRTNTLILDHQDGVDYKFHNHKLRLVSSSSPSFQEEEDEENSDDDDEEDYSCRKSELICDGCITPIVLKQASSSPSSSSCSSSSSSNEDYCYYYMRCSIRSCKYYLHLACFCLPPQLSSLPLIHNHSLVLQSGDKLKPWKWQECSICRKDTNGLYYDCTKCYSFKVDIKCASMPDTIYHAAHPPHPLNLLSKEDTRTRDNLKCDGCPDSFFVACNSYACGSCDFMVHFKCAILPASTTSRRWDNNHPLPLMHDATVNRPGDFYCNRCEQDMNPKSWMYHCRSCDISFHPRCLVTTSGWFRNIKFGQKYVITGAHCHTLTFQILTTKRSCDVCRYPRHESLGFYCASCVFFICFHSCGEKMIKKGNVEAVD
ncbi:uncharacterized protein LOC125207010 [Salvia hispanica]|uniref:uncharacterized protein LOC125207010 n=1 Tax=Salvia hispanica TaxID=49212 RepID=UPI0020094528|nr:uncharacterized protein LOC125207010 [Salvia hispanica]